MFLSRCGLVRELFILSIRLRKAMLFMAIRVLILVLFFVVTIAVGIYYRNQTSSVSDFVLGGRTIGPWLSALTYGVSYFSAIVFVGFAGQFGWRFGTSAIWIGLGNAFIGSLMAWFVLGKRTRVMTNHLNSATMPEFFFARYGSSALKIGAAIIIFIFMIPSTAALYNGLSRLFAMAFGFDFIYVILAMSVLTAVYVVIGGLFATSVNNLIQGAIMLVGIVAIVAAVLIDNGGFTAAMQSLARVEAAETALMPGAFTSFFGPDPISLLGVVIITSLGTWGMPHMVARYYSIQSADHITKGAVISTAFALVVAFGSYFIGSFGRLYSDVVEVSPDGGVVFDSIIPAMLSQFSDVLIGLVILTVFAASISSLAVMVMASASTLTLDFFKGHIVKNMGDKTQLFFIRILIVVFIAISAVIAIWQYRGGLAFIAQLMGISWGAMAGSFLAPLLYGLFWKRVSIASVWCCYIFSTGLMILNMFFRSAFPAILQSTLNLGAFTILAGLIIVPVVSVLTKSPNKAHLESCFSCFKSILQEKK